MNLLEIFKYQIENNVTEIFFYGVEKGTNVENIKIDILNHKDSLNSFPANLEYVRMLNDHIPLFKEVE